MDVTGERVEVYRDQADEWRWRYFAANGEEESRSSEGYDNESHAARQARETYPGVLVVHV